MGNIMTPKPTLVDSFKPILYNDLTYTRVHSLIRGNMQTKTICFQTLKLLMVIGFFAVGGIGCDDVAMPEDTTRVISYVDLADSFTDLAALAILPNLGEKTEMWSSYSRASLYDDTSGEYKNWSHNIDGLGYIRKEGNGFVIAEMKGPGCIKRIWSAFPGDGHVKIYLDGKLKPAVDLPFSEYFDGSQSSFNFPQLVYTSAEGANNYVPIPYQKSCKIVAEPQWGLYYHINYTSYPAGTKIPTFQMNLGHEELGSLEKANNFFDQQMGESPYQKQDEDVSITNKILIETGQTVSLAAIYGQYAIKAIKIKTISNENVTKDQERILRKLVLQIKWDGETDPSVWAPLGDFFGTAPGINTYRTLPAGMTHEEFYCYWYMPFSESAQLEIINEDDQAHTLEFEIIYGEINQPIKTLGQFHAKWHRDVFPIEDISRWPDWTLLKTQGKGRFVGMMLNVWNPRAGSCMDGTCGEGGAWWGEGDEKFFIDGENFPSLFGTGTEDYFGYAWGMPAFFEKAFHSQSRTSVDNKGYITLCRWHISDNIPFQENFDGYIEKYWPNEWPTQYSCMVYWYLSPGGMDPHLPVPVEERYGYETPY